MRVRTGRSQSLLSTDTTHPLLAERGRCEVPFIEQVSRRLSRRCALIPLAGRAAHWRRWAGRPRAAAFHSLVWEPCSPERPSKLSFHAHTRLPERQREAVLLHHFAGFDHRRIADVLGVSPASFPHRGLAALRSSLGRKCVLDFGDDVPCERR